MQGWYYTECLTVRQKNNGQTNETAGQLLSVRNLFIAATTCMWHWPSLLRRGSLWGIFNIGSARGEWWEQGKGGSSFPFPSFLARCRFSLSAKKPLRSKQHERVLCGGERHWPICKTLDLSFIWGHDCLHLGVMDDQSVSWLLNYFLHLTWKMNCWICNPSPLELWTLDFWYRVIY